MDRFWHFPARRTLQERSGSAPPAVTTARRGGGPGQPGALTKSYRAPPRCDPASGRTATTAIPLGETSRQRPAVFRGSGGRGPDLAAGPAAGRPLHRLRRRAKLHRPGRAPAAGRGGQNCRLGGGIIPAPAGAGITPRRAGTQLPVGTRHDVTPGGAPLAARPAAPGRHRPAPPGTREPTRSRSSHPRSPGIHHGIYGQVQWYLRAGSLVKLWIHLPCLAETGREVQVLIR